MTKFKDRVYTVGDTSIPAWVRKLDQNQNHEYGYEIVIKGLQLEIDSLTAKLNTTIKLSNELNEKNLEKDKKIEKLEQDLAFSKKHAENLHDEVVRRGSLMIARYDKIEELEYALRYLHDSVAEHYPNFVTSPAMMTALDALMGESE